LAIIHVNSAELRGRNEDDSKMTNIVESKKKRIRPDYYNFAITRRER